MKDDQKKQLREVDGRLQDLADLPAVQKILDQQERLRELVDPPAIRAIREQQERFQNLAEPAAIRVIHEQQERLQDLVEPPAIKVIREQQERLQDLIDPPALRAIRDQQEAMRDLIDSWDLPSLAALDSTRLTAAFSLGAPTVEAALRGACLEEKAKLVGFASSGVEKLLSGIAAEDLRNSREVLSAGLEFLASPFESGPSDIVSDMPSEIFRTLDVDAMVCGSTEANVEKEREEIRNRTSDILEIKLADLDSELVGLLAGARSAAYSDNPDRTRHVCVSLRELLGHALRQLAPDSAIRQWSNESTHFHNDKPTRRARLEYLYRGVYDPALSKLISVDIGSAINLFDILSSATHKAMFAESQEAALLLLGRAEGVLLLLLRLSSDGNGYV